MAEQQYTSIVESEESLRKFLDMISGNLARLKEAWAGLESDNGDNEAGVAGVRDSYTALSELLTAHGEKVQAALEGMSAQLDKLPVQTTESAKAIEADATADSAAGEKLVAELTQSEAAINEQADDNREALTAADAAAREQGATLTGRYKDLVEHFDQLDENAGEYAEATGELQEEGEAQCNEYTETIAETATAAVTEAFEQTLGDLKDKHPEALKQAAEELIQGATGLMNGFSGNATELLNGLSEKVLEILNGLDEQAREAFESALKEAFEDALKEGITSLVEEVVEDVVIMTAGSEVTAVMAPILPELAATRKLLEGINAVKNLLGGGD